MTFSSPVFLTLFLPLTLAGVALSHRLAGPVAALAASLGFYGIWDWRLPPLLAASILVNHRLGRRLAARPSGAVLALAVVANLAVLGWFKYALFVSFFHPDPRRIRSTTDDRHFFASSPHSSANLSFDSG